MIQNSQCKIRYGLPFLVICIIGCTGGSGGGSGDASGGSDVGVSPANPLVPGIEAPPTAETPVAAGPGRAVWNERQGACLNSNNEPALNAGPLGKNAQCVDFSNQDLTGKDFTAFDLRGASFKNSVLTGIKIDGALIQGLVLDGAEVDSPALLQWLTTGVKPAILPTLAPIAPIIVVVPTSPRQNQEPESEEHGKNAEDSLLDPDQPVQDVADHVAEVHKISTLEKLESEIELSGLKLQRQVQQSLVKIDDLQLQESKTDIIAAKQEENSEKQDTLKSELENQIKNQETQTGKITDLVEAIRHKTKKYKKKHEQYARVTKSLHLVDPTKRAPSKDQRATNRNSDLGGKLEQQVQSLSAELASLEETKEILRKQVLEYDSKIQVLTQQSQELADQIQKLGSEVDSNNGKKSQTPGTDAQRAAQTNALTSEGNQVQAQLISLREQRVQPKSQLDTIRAQIETVSEALGAAQKQLREAELLTAVANAKGKG